MPKLWVCVGCVAVVCAACGGGDGGTGGRGAAGTGAAAGQGGIAGMTGAGTGAAGTMGGGFDAGTDPNRNNVMPGGICARLAEINCAGEQACCDNPGRDFAACRSAVETACSGTFLLDDIAGMPNVAFDAQGASAAFAQLEQRASMCDPTVAAWAVSPDGFAASFAGTLDNGADCQPEGGLGASIPVLLAALASCRIGSGLACLPGEDAWTCQPRAAAGGRCFTDLNCADGLYCENPSSGFNGMCAARKAQGQSCREPTECASFVCQSGMCAASNDVQAAYCLN